MKNIFIAAAAILSLQAGAYAMHPLMTEDTGVLGKGVRQVELAFQHTASHSLPDVYGNELAPVLSYGLDDKTDLLLGLPWVGWSQGGSSESGMSDLSLEAKMLLGEKYGWTWMVKPGFSLPAGDYDKGLGSDKATAWLYGIAGRTAGKFEAYLNAGYRCNDNKDGAEKNLWKASASGLYEFKPGLKAAADLEIWTNEDKAADEHPVEGLAGLVWGVNENLDLDLGVKYGLNEAAKGHALLGGVTYRF